MGTWLTLRSSGTAEPAWLLRPVAFAPQPLTSNVRPIIYMGKRLTLSGMVRQFIFWPLFPLFMCLIPTAYGGESYPTEARLYANAATEVLISKGICKDLRECSQMSLVFWEGGNPWIPTLKRAFINLYLISDEAVVDDVVAALKNRKDQTSGPPFTVTAYKSAHRETKVKLKVVKVD